jgi:DNA-binding transcriptional ArsR family regulator
MKKKSMDINLNQQKLISTPLRIKIIYLLAEQAMTAKQVADELGKTAGSIHYHIQQLYKGGILALEETKENKGIIEKYYRAKATEFRLKASSGPNEQLGRHSRGISLGLTPDELKEFEADFDELLEMWVKKTVREKQGRQSFNVYCQFEKIDNEGDS